MRRQRQEVICRSVCVCVCLLGGEWESRIWRKRDNSSLSLSLWVVMWVACHSKWLASRDRAGAHTVICSANTHTHTHTHTHRDTHTHTYTHTRAHRLKSTKTHLINDQMYSGEVFIKTCTLSKPPPFIQQCTIWENELGAIMCWGA